MRYPIRMLVALAFAAAPAAATVPVFHDGDFTTGAWTDSEIDYQTPGACAGPPAQFCGSATTTGDCGCTVVEDHPSGGNPGAWRAITNVIGVTTDYEQVDNFHFFVGATYDPRGGGAVHGLDYSEDVRQIQPQVAAQGEASGAVIRQDGCLYVGRVVKTCGGGTGWEHREARNLTPADFTRVYFVGSCATTPDFAGTGAEADATMAFGFYRANSTPVGQHSGAGTLTAGIDNWRIVLDTACASAADCDDGDACTTDACPGIACSHTFVDGCGTGKLTLFLTDHEHHWGDDGTIVYDVAVGNSATDASASGVVVTELVPQNTTFVAASSATAWSCAPDGNAGSTCTADVGDLAPSASVPLPFAVKVNDGTDPGYDVFDAAIATIGTGTAAPAALRALAAAPHAAIGIGPVPPGGVVAGDVTPSGNAVSACLDNLGTCCAVILYAATGGLQCSADDDCNLPFVGIDALTVTIAGLFGDPCDTGTCDCGGDCNAAPDGGQCHFDAHPMCGGNGGTLGTAAARAAMSTPASALDLTRYYRLREEVLAANDGGRRLITLYYRYTKDIVAATMAHHELLPLGLAALAQWNPMIDALIAGTAGNVTAEQVAALKAYLDALRPVASPDLRRALDRERALLAVDSWTGIRESAVLSHLYDLSCDRAATFDSVNCRIYGLTTETAAYVTSGRPAKALALLINRAGTAVRKANGYTRVGNRRAARAALKQAGKALSGFIGHLKTKRVAADIRSELRTEASELRADVKQLRHG